MFEKIGGRDLRAAGIEVDQSFKEMDGKTYELSRILESKPGSREFAHRTETEEDAYVLGCRFPGTTRPRRSTILPGGRADHPSTGGS